MTLTLNAFGDFVNALDNSLAGLVVLVIPFAGLVLAGWLREMLLASKARQAALRAELQAFESEPDTQTKREHALELLSNDRGIPRLFRPSRAKWESLLEREQPRAEKEATSVRTTSEPPPKS